MQTAHTEDGLQKKSKGHYCISQEAAISPNLLKFNISAHWAQGNSRRVSLALGSLNTLAANEVTFYQANGYQQGTHKSPF